jgi:hypothetical protein
VGPGKREYELFLARLEKDGFTVAHKATLVLASQWLKDEWPQAVLFTAECPPKTVTEIMRIVGQRKQKVPFVAVGLDTIPDDLAHAKGIGERFLLHSLALTHVVRRLMLGIQLCQIRPEDY